MQRDIKKKRKKKKATFTRKKQQNKKAAQIKSASFQSLGALTAKGSVPFSFHPRRDRSPLPEDLKLQRLIRD